VGLHGKRGILANLQSNRSRGLYLDVVGTPPGRDELLVSNTYLQNEDRTFQYRRSVGVVFTHRTIVSHAWL
jgi:hypothetical protein